MPQLGRVMTGGGGLAIERVDRHMKRTGGMCECWGVDVKWKRLAREAE